MFWYGLSYGCGYSVSSLHSLVQTDQGLHEVHSTTANKYLMQYICFSGLFVPVVLFNEATVSEYEAISGTCTCIVLPV